MTRVTFLSRETGWITYDFPIECRHSPHLFGIVVVGALLVPTFLSLLLLLVTGMLRQPGRLLVPQGNDAVLTPRGLSLLRPSPPVTAGRCASQPPHLNLTPTSLELYGPSQNTTSLPPIVPSKALRSKGQGKKGSAGRCGHGTRNWPHLVSALNAEFWLGGMVEQWPTWPLCDRWVVDGGWCMKVCVWII